MSPKKGSEVNANHTVGAGAKHTIGVYVFPATHSECKKNNIFEEGDYSLSRVLI